MCLVYSCKDSQVVLILNNTAELDLLEEVDDDWARVNAYGYEGYVSSAFLVYEIGERKSEPYFTLPKSTLPQAAASNNTSTYKTTATRANTSVSSKAVNV